MDSILVSRPAAPGSIPGISKIFSERFSLLSWCCCYFMTAKGLWNESLISPLNPSSTGVSSTAKKRSNWLNPSSTGESRTAIIKEIKKQSPKESSRLGGPAKPLGYRETFPPSFLIRFRNSFWTFELSSLANTRKVSFSQGLRSNCKKLGQVYSLQNAWESEGCVATKHNG